MTLPEKFIRRLRPHQVQPANWLYGQFCSGVQAQIDLSGTGSGKTYVAAAVMSAGTLPTLVIGPKIAQTTWERAAEHFEDRFSYVGYEKLRTGRTPFGTWEHMPPPGQRAETYYVCENCQREVDFEEFRPCYCHPQGIHCIATKKVTWKFGKFIFAPEVKAIVFDEVHRCSGMDSLNADMLIAAKRQGKIILGLSATAACSPLKMRALGYTLGLHTLNRNRDGSGLSFYDWAGRYHCRRVPMRGFQWMVGAKRQIEIMAEIRQSILPRAGVRVRVEDIPGFPKRDITAELYDLESAGQIDSLYREMEAPLAALALRAEADANPESPLTKILRAHQKIELLKTPIAVELAEDYLEKGYSIAVFVNYRQTLEEMCRRLKTDCFIDGSREGVLNRLQSIDRFQQNVNRKIVVNSKAGGVCVSLHDLDGGFPRVGLMFPCFSAETTQQVFGRLHRDGGKSVCHYRVMFAAGTMEVPMHRSLSSKLNNLEALNDADLLPESLKLTKVNWSGLC